MKKIFITGAAGFIGSRLVELLKERYNAELNVLLRSISRAARISRYQVNYFQGNITDEAVLDAAISGCDLVVHCAHDFSSDDANLSAADIISRLCIKHGVKRLIYISTAGVHRCDDKAVMTENSALNLSWSYAANKIAVEKKFIEYYQASQLPVIILRPSIIYGPFAGVWTKGFVRDMLESRVVFPFSGNRICNAVYIDDVVRAIISAMEVTGDITGQAYLVSGDERITWKQFIDAYQEYPDVQQVVYWDDEQSKKWYYQLENEPLTELKPSFKKDPVTYLKSTFLYGIYQKMLGNSFLKKKLLQAKSKIPRPLKHLSSESYEVFGCTAQIDISKIQSATGFKPAIDFSEGMRKTKIYLEWYNLNAN